MERIAPPIGRHENVPDETYHREWDALNNSTLSHLRRSPLHAWYAREHPPEPTDAMRIGKAVHKAILEPEAFDTAYVLDPMHPDGGYPRGWRNTKDYKAAKADLLERGFDVLSQSEFDQCRAMRDAVHSEPSEVRDVLTMPGTSEVSYVAKDSDTGLLCKVRADRVIPSAGMALDLKTTTDVTPQAFSRAIYNYGYHRQKPFYLDTMNAVPDGERFEHFLFLAVEKEAPYCCRLYDLDPAATHHGREEVATLKRVYQHCVEANEWPGPPRSIASIGIPEWAYFQTDEEEIAA